jgi:hypothetical protein
MRHAKTSRCLIGSGKIEWQRVGEQIDAAMIFAGADFVNMHGVKLLFPSGNRVSLGSQIFSQFDFHLGRRFKRHRI